MNSNSYLEKNATWKKKLFYLNVVYTPKEICLQIWKKRTKKNVCVCQCQRI